MIEAEVGEEGDTGVGGIVGGGTGVVLTQKPGLWTDDVDSDLLCRKSAVAAFRERERRRLEGLCGTDGVALRLSSRGATPFDLALALCLVEVAEGGLKPIRRGGVECVVSGDGSRVLMVGSAKGMECCKGDREDISDACGRGPDRCWSVMLAFRLPAPGAVRVGA